MELGENGRDWTPLIGLDRTTREWTGLDGQHLRGLDLMALHFTGLDCLSLSLTSPYCATPLYPGFNWNAPYRIASSLHVITIIAPNCIARLQMTVLHCMWMYSSGLDHTAELCTALDVTWKDCSGLPELQWS